MQMQKQSFPNQFPQFCKTYDGYKDLRNQLATCRDAYQSLIDKAKEDAAAHTLDADGLVKGLFSVASPINTEHPGIALAAKNRVFVGNPPGKAGSMGDAINWEALLHEAPNGDLYFVGVDKDFRSPLDSARFSEFLSNEWTDQKKGVVRYYTSLSDYLTHNHPEISIHDADERQSRITSLISSSSFASTHARIAALSEYEDFTGNEVNLLLAAAESNDQIRNILADADVEAFYKRVIDLNATGTDLLLVTHFYANLYAMQDRISGNE